MLDALRHPGYRYIHRAPHIRVIITSSHATQFRTTVVTYANLYASTEFLQLMDTLPVHSIAFFDHAIWQEELQGLVLCLLPLTLRR
jgi:hypothetical protein